MDGDKMKQPRTSCTCNGPPAGVFKINSDGAISDVDGRAASGCVAREMLMDLWQLGVEYIRGSLTL